LRSGWNPDPSDRAPGVLRQVRVVQKVAEPTDPDDATSRWMIASPESVDAMRRLRGHNDYTPRMGVFTGGANAVFYLQHASSNPCGSRYRNITANAKRKVAEVDVDVEPQLVHSVARGRDIGMWHYRPAVFLLVPHTTESQMYPIPQATLESDFPKAFRYLSSMAEPLRARNGFAGWEKRIHKQHFYTLQRIGPYTFSPYKVCWRYIANEFTVCVLESDADGKTIVPNDKVMFIPMDNACEAYFVAGFLSSTLLRGYVASVMEKRQISAGVIRSIAIPKYDPDCESHRVIQDCCRRGHAMLEKDTRADVDDLKSAIDDQVDRLVAGWPTRS
jgi:hypothetical protein